MKVLHIHTGARGPQDACLRIHKALLAQGVDSKVLTRFWGGDAFVYEDQQWTLNRYIPPQNKVSPEKIAKDYIAVYEDVLKNCGRL